MNVPECPHCEVQYSGWGQLMICVDGHTFYESNEWYKRRTCFCGKHWALGTDTMIDHLKEVIKNDGNLEAHYVLGMLAR